MPEPWVGFHVLVARAKAGDGTATGSVLSILLVEMKPVARKYAGTIKPREATTDLLQESCLRAWQKIDTFRGGENDLQTFHAMLAWMAEIIRHKAADHRRDAGRMKRNPPGAVVSLDQPARGTDGSTGPQWELEARDKSPSSNARRSALRDRVRRHLGTLEDPVDARILHLRMIEQREYSKIAVELGISLSRARDRFHELFADLASKLRREGWGGSESES